MSPINETSIPRTYVVAGMTCEHCVRAVTEEISDVAGVERVDVELQTGRVVVYGNVSSDAAVREAVAEAGYEVVS